MAYYGTGTIGNEKPSELIGNAKAQTDTTGYDHIMVLHAGYGEETSNKIEDIHSQTPLSNYSIIPEMEDKGISPFGVWCHEFGHQLGLLDMYGTTAKIGNWSLMSYGCYNGQGSFPAHLDAYSKSKLGWVNPTQAEENLTLLLKPISQVFRLGTPYEYFLVEWREKKGVDSFIPGEGFLIYHIKEIPTITTAILPADAEWDGYGDDGDPWPGSSGNTAPSLLYYNGSPSGFSIKIITPSILQIKAYPNPLNLAKNNTVFFDAPPKSLIKIYNINGELVGEAKDRYIGKMSWKPKDIASGVYIFVAEDPEGNRGYGKIGVIK